MGGRCFRKQSWWRLELPSRSKERRLMGNSSIFLYLPAILHAFAGGGTPDPAGDGILYDTVRPGHATYYDFADGTGACMLEQLPEPQYVGAIGISDYYTPAVDGKAYQQATLCGAYAKVSGSKGSIIIKIVDLCPDAICTKGHIDLSPEAFAAVGNLIDGYIPISWQLISKPMTGNIALRYKDGSSQWWTAIQVRNHRNPVATLEVKKGDTWEALSRTDYNYFLAPWGLGVGYHTFRLTDVFGHQLIETSSYSLNEYIPNAVDWAGSGQFPAP